MLKEGDGCDPVVSHVPCGVLWGVGGWGGGQGCLVLTFSSTSSPPQSGLLHSCPLLSFDIWSLFSISNTRAPAMTPLLKMPRIRIFSELTFRARVRLKVFACTSNSPFFLWFHTV